jgi:hypothetical protein
MKLAADHEAPEAEGVALIAGNATRRTRVPDCRLRECRRLGSVRKRVLCVCWANYRGTGSPRRARSAEERPVGESATNEDDLPK